MADFSMDGQHGVPSPCADYDLDQLFLDAFKRWLKPAEVCEILNNRHQLRLSEAAPVKPSSGSLFLFDRNKLRYFRKDGHNWRKKKDGRTVREAHEKLKAGNKEAVHCYYAHGEDNPNFQRRSYWLLESGYDNIVLVHYREVTEGNRLEALAPMLEVKCGPVYSQMQWANAGLGDADYTSPSFISSPSEVVNSSCNSQEAVYDIDSGDELGENQRLGGRICKAYQTSVLDNELGLDSAAGTSYIPTPVSLDANINTPTMLSNTSVNTVSLYQQDLAKGSQEGLQGLPWPDVLGNPYSITDTSVAWTELSQPQQSEVVKRMNLTANSLESHLVSKDLKSDSRQDVKSNDDARSFSIKNQSNTSYPTALRKLSETESGEVWTPNDALLTPTLSCIMQSIRSERIVPTLNNSVENISIGQYSASSATNLPEQTCFNNAQNLMMNIKDFAPDWSYAFEKTKVLVVGIFFDSERRFSSINWACKFGDVEVPANIVQFGVLSCTVPPHQPGKISFCITCSDGIPCSNVMDFEFREKSPNEISNNSLTNTKSSKTTEETKLEDQAMLHQVRLANFLLTEDTTSHQEDPIDPSTTQKGNEKRLLLVPDEIFWTQMESLVKEDRHPYDKSKAMLGQVFFKAALFRWLQRKSNQERVSVLDGHGQGLLHRAAALGYEWAIAPLLEAGVGVNFRDGGGWTALHYAAFYGREKVIALLLAAGASPGALTDPTPTDPTGRTASDLAAVSGQDGIAGYLGEALVTSHFTSLNLSELKKLSMAQNQSIAVISERSKVVDESLGVTDDDLSLRDSLAAVRNAAQAEACIALTFRAYSFQRKKEKEDDLVDEFGILDEQAQAFATAQAISRGSYEKSNLAATQIQCKYRGWKARSEYLSLKKHVVKIQAHVRGHQARKRYEKILWTVSILDKVILRWRRKGAGLRGYKVEDKEKDDSDDDSYLRDFRKQKEAAFSEAVSRVKQMMQNPEARSQYRRMLEIYETEKGNQLNEELNYFDDDELMDILG